MQCGAANRKERRCCPWMFAKGVLISVVFLRGSAQSSCEAGGSGGCFLVLVVVSCRAAGRLAAHVNFFLCVCELPRERSQKWRFISGSRYCWGGRN